MTEAIQTSQSFDERMMAKIKESIGELVTDDELKKIIEKGMSMAFFEPRRSKSRDSWQESILPPLAQGCSI
jgi:hypothetical protein